MLTFEKNKLCMAKKAILFSAQNFPLQVKKRLKGCINDTTIWRETLQKLGFTINDSDLYHNENRLSALTKITNFVDQLMDDDTGIIFFSGHGIQEHYYPKNSYHEGIVFNLTGVLYDYEIMKAVQVLKHKPLTKLILISDSCHSKGIYDLKRFSLINTYTVLESLLHNKIVTDEILLEYEHDLSGIKERFSLPISSHSLLNREINIPKDISVPKSLFDQTLKKASVLKEIKKFLEQPSNQHQNISLLENHLIYHDKNKDINVLEISEKGISDSSIIMNKPNPPEEEPVKLSQLPNVTYILAEKDITKKAYEKLFKIDVNTNKYYGVFSNYATKAILANPNITYGELLKKVNTEIQCNETNDPNINAQRMHIESGNTNWNRKLFT